MAEKMMPYALRMTLAVLANKPDDARSISAECVTAMTKELMGVVSRYDLMDFPFMVAALRLTATSLESLLDEHGKGIADNIVANTTCITIDASGPNLLDLLYMITNQMSTLTLPIHRSVRATHEPFLPDDRIIRPLQFHCCLAPLASCA